MSANFVNASSQRLVNSSPGFTDYPFTVGLWVMPVSATAGAYFTLADTGTNNNQIMVEQSTTQIRISAVAGGTSAAATITTTFTANKWHYIVARAISSTNRRIAGVFPAGQTLHAASSTSRAPTSMDTLAIGAYENSSPGIFFDGMIAELWYTATDIQADGAQLQDSLLRQLAYGGPFSVPHIAKDIIEYRSFKSTLDSKYENWCEVYSQSAKQNWTNTNGVTIGPHPPLPGSYVRMTRPYRTRAHKMIRSPLIIPALATGYTPPNRSLRTNSLMMMGSGR